jgi:hypothetical protein
VLVSPEVKGELKRFVHATLMTGPGAKFRKENDAARALFGNAALPLVILMGPDGKEISRLPPEGKANFLISKEQLLEALRKIP